VFASGQDYKSVDGTVAAGQLAPAVYTLNIRTGREEYEVRVVFSAGNVRGGLLNRRWDQFGP
jgi:hypothetical protein